MICGGGDDGGIWRRSFKQLWELLWAVVEGRWMAVEGQRDAKNTALIPGVRTLADSKLGVDHFRGSASLELYRGLTPSCCSKVAEKIHLLLMKRGGIHDYL